MIKLSQLLHLMQNYQKMVVLLFFTAILSIGLSVYKDYGISWDEETTRTNGTHSYNYVFKGDHTLFTYKDRDYGVAFELPLIIIEKHLNIENTRDLSYMALMYFFIFLY